CCGGIGPEFSDLVCAEHDVSGGPAGARVWLRIRRAGACERRAVGARVVDHGDRRDLLVQGWNDHDTAGVLRGWDRTPSRRPCRMNFRLKGYEGDQRASAHYEGV